jgi:hypothetical protein
LKRWFCPIEALDERFAVTIFVPMTPPIAHLKGGVSWLRLTGFFALLIDLISGIEWSIID